MSEPVGGPTQTRPALEVVSGGPSVQLSDAALARSEGIRINDFAFKIGTVNGTGSASANGLLMQALFRMGIPISGKNVFPSNIQGLPTWYEIRVNGKGYTARTPDFDLIVAMNTETFAKDIAEVRSGGWVLYDSSWPLDSGLLRKDVTFLGVPMGNMCVEAFKGGRERTLMKNIVYVGALAALLDMDMEIIKGMIEEKFSRKPKLIDSNFKAIRMGYDYTRAHYECPLPIRLQSMNENGNKVIMDGNTAAALGCVYAGATVGAWYPITPATSLMDAFQDFCNRYRTDPEDRREALLHRAGGRRAGRSRRGHRRGVVGRARIHQHVGARYRLDERVHRARLLHRDPGGLLRHPADGTVHRDADAHAAG